MDIALIPPASQLDHLMSRKIQMMIPAYTKNARYRWFYRNFGHNSDMHVILDNGAFEGARLSPHDLLGMAYDYQVDEIIIPDEMGDMGASMYMLEEFMAKLVTRKWHPKYVMAAVQGQTVEECHAHIRNIAEHTSEVTTLGLPKHLDKTTGWEGIRVKLTEWILKEFPNMWDIHFLGYIREGEMMSAAEVGVRSLDTSAPFICAAELMSINPSTYASWSSSWNFEVPERQKNFADLPKEYFHPKLIKDNIDQLDRWAAYDGNP
jgi:hypothetical protein